MGCEAPLLVGMKWDVMGNNRLRCGPRFASPSPSSELQELSDAEKTIIAAAVGYSLEGQITAQLRWTKIPWE